MLYFFKNLSQSRSAWFLLMLSCLILEGTALYFQHGMGLVPCVMCIYERVALFGILFAGILGFLGNRYAIIRYLAILIWLGSAFKGLVLSIKHHDYQVNPSPWNQCEFKVNFPQTLPLDQWLPQVFAPVRLIVAKANGNVRLFNGTMANLYFCGLLNCCGHCANQPI